jgi:hypothetical protein
MRWPSAQHQLKHQHHLLLSHRRHGCGMQRMGCGWAHWRSCTTSCPRRCGSLAMAASAGDQKSDGPSKAQTHCVLFWRQGISACVRVRGGSARSAMLVLYCAVTFVAHMNVRAASDPLLAVADMVRCGTLATPAGMRSGMDTSADTSDYSVSASYASPVDVSLHVCSPLLMLIEPCLCTARILAV